MAKEGWSFAEFGLPEIDHLGPGSEALIGFQRHQAVRVPGRDAAPEGSSDRGFQVGGRRPRRVLPAETGIRIDRVAPGFLGGSPASF